MQLFSSSVHAIARGLCWLDATLHKLPSFDLDLLVGAGHSQLLTLEADLGLLGLLLQEHESLPMLPYIMMLRTGLLE